MNRVKIKLEIERDGKPKQEVEYVYEKVHVEWAQGLIKHYDDQKHCTEIELNGQGRVLIKAWKGCNTFDTFEKESKA